MDVHRTVLTLFCCMVGFTMPAVALGQSAEDGIVDSANAVLVETMTLPNERIPQKLLSDACGIAIVPNTVKGGFVVGVRRGHGVILARGENGSWQAPTFVTMTGGSVGWQAGIQSTDVILVFRTRKGLESLFRNKLTLGVDAGVAAGPAGRQATAATDLALQAEILSYSRSRGLFAGVALDGAAMALDSAANNRYYAAANSAGSTLPASAARLVATLTQYSRAEGAPGELAPVATQPVSVPAPAAPNSLPATKAEAIRQQLAQSSLAMNQVIDDSWRQFLALPPGLATPNQPVPYQSLVDTIARYDKVAADQSYAALAQRPEFTATRRLLQDYAALMTTNADTRLVLPQPPMDPSAAP